MEGAEYEPSPGGLPFRTEELPIHHLEVESGEGSNMHTTRFSVDIE